MYMWHVPSSMKTKAKGVLSGTREDGCIVWMLWDSLIHIVLYSQNEGEELFGSPTVFNLDTAVSC